MTCSSIVARDPQMGRPGVAVDSRPIEEKIMTLEATRISEGHLSPSFATPSRSACAKAPHALTEPRDP
jgi:hypothetical protein